MIKLKTLLLESFQNLYHAMRVEYAYEALKKNALEGRSIQRYWPDGKRRHDTDKQYDKSFWMKGLSLTRDINFAKRWGAVVLELDASKLRSHYKIIPFAWNYQFDPKSRTDRIDYKKEREEFLLTAKLPRTQYQLNKSVKDWLNKPYGKPIPLGHTLLGIWMDKRAYDTFYGPRDASTQFIVNHPKFRGFFEKNKND